MSCAGSSFRNSAAGTPLDGVVASWRCNHIAAFLRLASPAPATALLNHRTSGAGHEAATWLADVRNPTRREAGRLIRSGQELSRLPIIAQAAATGAVLPAQWWPNTGFGGTPDYFPADAVNHGQQLIAQFAAHHHSAELPRLTGGLFEVLTPDLAESLDAAGLEKDERAAQRNRYLRFHGDGYGSVRIKGSLPIQD